MPRKRRFVSSVRFAKNVVASRNGNGGSNNRNNGDAINNNDIKIYLRYYIPDSTNYAEYHRSGWFHALSGLKELEDDNSKASSSSFSASASDAAVILFDSYVDRTFHWEQDRLMEEGLLPYPEGARWAGVLHHTFDTTHSSHNCTELFENNAVFKASLRQCVALFTLSEHLASRVRQALQKLRSEEDYVHPLPEVISVRHPTESVLVPKVFTMDKFLKNPDRHVVQIGAWLRNPFAIYDLPLRLIKPREYVNKKHSGSLRTTKAVLRAKDSDVYFPPMNFGGLMRDLETVGLEAFWEEHLSSSDRTAGDGDDLRVMNALDYTTAIPYVTNNMMARHVLQAMSDKKRDVKVIERLSNDKYDDLLSMNAVFLEMVDASAVNTVIECIVRHTPVIVNRLPALEEVLGKDYPGFYGGESDLNAFELVSNWNTYRMATRYLASLDKSKFQLNEFVKDVHDGLIRAIKLRRDGKD